MPSISPDSHYIRPLHASECFCWQNTLSVQLAAREPDVDPSPLHGSQAHALLSLGATPQLKQHVVQPFVTSVLNGVAQASVLCVVCECVVCTCMCLYMYAYYCVRMNVCMWWCVCVRDCVCACVFSSEGGDAQSRGRGILLWSTLYHQLVVEHAVSSTCCGARCITMWRTMWITMWSTLYHNVEHAVSQRGARCGSYCGARCITMWSTMWITMWSTMWIIMWSTLYHNVAHYVDHNVEHAVSQCGALCGSLGGARCITMWSTMWSTLYH